MGIFWLNYILLYLWCELLHYKNKTFVVFMHCITKFTTYFSQLHMTSSLSPKLLKSAATKRETSSLYKRTYLFFFFTVLYSSTILLSRWWTNWNKEDWYNIIFSPLLLYIFTSTTLLTHTFPLTSAPGISSMVATISPGRIHVHHRHCHP